MTPGYVLADKYRLVSLIGRGGMGAVWRAERLDWGSAVAVKLVERASEAHPDVLARFRQEARLAANLRSSHVVQVLDDGCDASTGTPFMVMELLEGETLAQRLARVERLSAAETSRIVIHVARALALAHELGMVHRDLKPDNIFLVPNYDEESAKVLDFGIAKWRQDSLFVDAPTSTGTAIGTPSYMSPEQIRDSKRVDYRTDLWSLALIASECLTGRRAFEANNLLSLALQICNERPPVPSSLGAVPAGFDAWFARATEPRLEQRFGSARELAEALRQLCGGAAAVVEQPAPQCAPSPAEPLPHEPTEVIRIAQPNPSSTEGLTRAAVAVAAFRSGRRGRRAVSVLVGALALAGAGVAVRSELTPRFAQRSAGQGTEGTMSHALRTAKREPGAPSVAASSAAFAASSAAFAAPATPVEHAAGVESSALVPVPRAPKGATAALAASVARGATQPGRANAAGGAVTESRAAVRVPAALGDGSAAAPSEPGRDEGAAASVLAAPANASSAIGAAVPAPAEAGAPVGAPPGGKPFDREAARVALEHAATQAQGCRPPGGPRGRGRIQVRFEPSGRVGAAWLMTPEFDNTVAGSCALMLFRRATVPEFAGAPAMVTQTFEVP